MRTYLKELREAKAMTQLNVAESLHVAQTYYHYIEHGERQKDISLDLLIKLSDVLEVSLDKLIAAEREYKSSITS